METRNSKSTSPKSVKKNETEKDVVDETEQKNFNDKGSGDEVDLSNDNNQTPLPDDSIEMKNIDKKEQRKSRSTTAKKSSEVKKPDMNKRSPSRRRSIHEQSVGESFNRKRTNIDKPSKTKDKKGKIEKDKSATEDLKTVIRRLKSEWKNRNFQFTKLSSLGTILVLGGGVLVLVIGYLIFTHFTFDVSDDDKFNITTLKKAFPKQEDRLWRAVGGGINDTLTFHHPTVYVLLYKAGNEETTKHLLKKLSEYAACHLSNCDSLPIELNGKILTSPDFAGTEDYGFLVAKFKEPLERTGVMVVEDLDEIPGKYAPAFHSFCDEISPLVKKSVFFLTIKVEEYGRQGGGALLDVKNVERILKEKWRNLEEEVFEPLFARLTPMVLRIQAER